MNDTSTIMIVDDDAIMRLQLENALSDTYHVISLASGMACLAALVKQQPDLIFLDVEMPGMDGYETCRRIKELEGGAVPVVFITSHDQLQDRLNGYDAGGDDYILKPVEPDELLAKTQLRLRSAKAQVELKKMADYAQTTAMTAMSSMGEMGVLLQALQRFNDCSKVDDLALALLRALGEYALDGMVRVRTAQGVVMLTTHGEVSPIEISIIEQVATMGRIVEFSSRLSVSYDHVTLLVRNAPLKQDDRRGRLRDHLAVLAEGAEVRTMALLRDQVIKNAITQGSRTLDRVDESQREVRFATSLALQNMTDQLEKAYIKVALSESQEIFMANIVSNGIDSVRAAFLPETDVQLQLTNVINELKTVMKQ